MHTFEGSGVQLVKLSLAILTDVLIGGGLQTQLPNLHIRCNVEPAPPVSHLPRGANFAASPRFSRLSHSPGVSRSRCRHVPDQLRGSPETQSCTQYRQ